MITPPKSTIGAMYDDAGKGRRMCMNDRYSDAAGRGACTKNGGLASTAKRRKAKPKPKAAPAPIRRKAAPKAPSSEITTPKAEMTAPAPAKLKGVQVYPFVLPQMGGGSGDAGEITVDFNKERVSVRFDKELEELSFLDERNRKSNLGLARFKPNKKTGIWERKISASNVALTNDAFTNINQFLKSSIPLLDETKQPAPAVERPDSPASGKDLSAVEGLVFNLDQEQKKDLSEKLYEEAYSMYEVRKRYGDLWENKGLFSPRKNDKRKAAMFHILNYDAVAMVLGKPLFFDTLKEPRFKQEVARLYKDYAGEMPINVRAIARHIKEVEAKVAPITEADIAQYINDIDQKKAENAFMFFSYQPEKLGENRRRLYASNVAFLKKLADKWPAERQAEAQALFENARTRLKEAVLNILAKQSRVANWAVVGPANFSVAQQERRKASLYKAMEDYESKVLKATKRLNFQNVSTREAKKAAYTNNAREAQVYPFEGGRVVLDFAANRLKIINDSIPPPEVRAMYKANAFKWSRANKAWQRILTFTAVADTNRMLLTQIPNPFAKSISGMRSARKVIGNAPALGAIVTKSTAFTQCADGTYSTAKKYPCRTRGGVAQVQKAFFKTGGKSDACLSRYGFKYADTYLVPLDQITTDEAKFQNRFNAFSQDSAGKIVEAVKAGRFNWGLFDPVILLKNPAYPKYVVLSGHSRTAAFRKLAAQKASAGGRTFAAIPAKIIETDLNTAQNIALNSNTLATPETILERAAYYRDLIRRGADRADVQERVKATELKNAALVWSLTYLNPRGKTMAALQALQGKDLTSNKNLEVLASWIGQTREAFPELSDQHENEMYDFLKMEYGKSFTRLPDFKQKIRTIIAQRSNLYDTFNPDTPLNLFQTTTKSSYALDYEAQERALKEEIKKQTKEIERQRATLAARLADKSPTERAREIERLLMRKNQALNTSRLKLIQLQQTKGNVLKAERSAPGLFGIRRRIIL